jgi:hypothetical protein
VSLPRWIFPGADLLDVQVFPDAEAADRTLRSEPNRRASATPSQRRLRISVHDEQHRASHRASVDSSCLIADFGRGIGRPEQAGGRWRRVRCVPLWLRVCHVSDGIAPVAGRRD